MEPQSSSEIIKDPSILKRTRENETTAIKKGFPRDTPCYAGDLGKKIDKEMKYALLLIFEPKPPNAGWLSSFHTSSTKILGFSF